MCPARLGEIDSVAAEVWCLQPRFGRESRSAWFNQLSWSIANTIDSEHKVPKFRQLETTHVRVCCQNLSNKFKHKKAGRTPTAVVRQPFDSAFLAAIENLVAGLARAPKLPPKFRHRFASRRATNCSLSSIHRTLLPRRPFPLERKGKV